MELRNYTPFSPLVFESRDRRDRELMVLVLRGTFDIIPGQPLRPCADQDPVLEADQHWSKPESSSLRLESDLAPLKLRSDIHLIADAHSPGAGRRPSWIVEIKIGQLQHRLRVTGARSWTRGSGHWQLSSPLPAQVVPLRYENAFGGTFEYEDGQGRQTAVFEDNPLGKGFVLPHRLGETQSVEAPQIEDPDDPVLELGQPHPPQGVGPIARSWNPRRARAGTFDEQWKQQRWPRLPDDFKEAHYNSAHPSLVYPGYLRGDEQVTFKHLSPDGLMDFSLPGYAVFVLVRHEDGSMIPAPTQLDTAVFDVPRSRCHLTWRFTMLRGPTVRVLEARMETTTGADRG